MVSSLCIADLDYDSLGSGLNLTYTPVDEENMRLCINIPILNDTVFEVDEEFSVTLISAHPEGEFIDDTTCIKIVDDDSKWHVEHYEIIIIINDITAIIKCYYGARVSKSTVVESG